MESMLQVLSKEHSCSLYELSREPGKSRVFIASTPETRAICNDPFITGTQYTRSLTAACAKTLQALKKAQALDLKEADTTVLHILRGGLNFGLREALSDAFSWNDHASAFVSAQRARSSTNPADWIITETAYSKLHLRKIDNVVFGDVVATGTSLRYALQQIGHTAKASGSEICSLTFFTIGSPCSHAIIDEIDREYRLHFPDYQGSSVIYIEGIFQMATDATAMKIKIDGTDLLRTESVLAPEFIESQYEYPSFPLERCTIYDAGSRAFDIDEYLHDVKDYWHQTMLLAEGGMTFKQLLHERFPELDAQRFGDTNLETLARAQLSKAQR
ncbi:MAG: hypothetical protein J0M12_06780 [Deltaproteobacteria bacterium]|nr:hypothetical protein [Deltaproteobacteria bacterium]